MNTLWQLPAVVLAVLSWLWAPPAGLAEIAQREAFRRSASPRASASLSNLGLPVDAVPPSAVTMPAAQVPPPSGGTEAVAAETAGASEKKPDPPKDQNWWRNKMSELRAALEKDQLAAEALQSRINALQADAVNLDDPIRQTKARMDLVRALEELDKTRKQIEADSRAVSALQDEARRLNIPAGWIR